MSTTHDYLDKDLYAVLGLSKGASAAEIKRAYRKLARELHPDQNKNKPDTEERFKEVSEAYAVLGNEDRRKEYDEGRDLLLNGAFRARRPDAAEGIQFDFGDLFSAEGLDLDDLLGGIFGHSRGSASTRGSDVETEVSIDFHAAIDGTTVPLHLGGRTINARIPAGVADGQRIRLRGKGGAGGRGGPAGDLYVTVHVRAHPVFGRDGDNVTVTVPVTFPEAALGADIQVPTPDGTPVTVRLPAGTADGRVLRVRGKGARRKGGPRGDLLVTVRVAVPATLSIEARHALEAFAAATAGDDPRAGLLPPRAGAAAEHQRAA